MDEKYDQAFLGVLQNEGKIEPFLDAVIGFLYRRTDYFRILRSKEDKLGFAPGIAERILASTFKKYEQLATKDEIEAQKRFKQKATPSAQPGKSEPTKAKVEQTEVAGKAGATSSSETNVNNKVVVKNTSEDRDSSTAAQSKSQTVDTAEQGKGDQQPTNTNKNTGEEDDNPELTKQQQEFQSRPDSYNGAVRDNYSWSQSITDLDLRVQVPAHVKKGRDVKVAIEKKRACVKHLGQTGEWVEVVNGELTWEVQKDECIWSLVPGDHVHINFEKKEERWWEAVLVNEPKISVRKIDASRPMTDLDDEAQAKIAEMMYNDQQKKLGKPQSHEQKTHDMLRGAWNAEGSPFKGQEFDPSKFSVDQSGMVTMKPS